MHITYMYVHHSILSFTLLSFTQLSTELSTWLIQIGIFAKVRYYANVLLPQTALEFAQGYRARTNQSLVPDYAYYVFDAVWATAMALNNSSEVNNTGEVRRAFGNLEFTGVSVSFITPTED